MPGRRRDGSQARSAASQHLAICQIGYRYLHFYNGTSIYILACLNCLKATFHSRHLIQLHLSLKCITELSALRCSSTVQPHPEADRGSSSGIYLARHTQARVSASAGRDLSFNALHHLLRHTVDLIARACVHRTAIEHREYKPLSASLLAVCNTAPSRTTAPLRSGALLAIETEVVAHASIRQRLENLLTRSSAVARFRTRATLVR